MGSITPEETKIYDLTKVKHIGKLDKLISSTKGTKSAVSVIDKKNDLLLCFKDN